MNKYMLIFTNIERQRDFEKYLQQVHGFTQGSNRVLGFLDKGFLFSFDTKIKDVHVIDKEFKLFVDDYISATLSACKAVPEESSVLSEVYIFDMKDNQLIKG